MSWDIVLFSSAQKIDSIEEVDESLFIATDFCEVLDSYFGNTNDKDYSIDYYEDEEPVSNKMISLYGENALYALVIVAQKHGWQIFDTSLNTMIDLENPANNGYENFQQYLNKIQNL